VKNIYNTLWENIRDNKYKILSESAWFCRRLTKTFGVFWGSQFQ